MQMNGQLKRHCFYRRHRSQTAALVSRGRPWLGMAGRGVLLRVLLVVGWACGASCLNLCAVDLPPGFVVETLATNLNAATAVAAAPAPDSRIFIAEQTGQVLVVKDNRLLVKPALSLHVTDYWERGLIGLTLAPGFPREPHLFALYVTDRPVVHHVLSRFTIRGDEIEPASEVILFEGDDQAKLGGTVPAGHQGGVLRFGPAGKLYVSVGEQTAGEPAQRLDTLQGKILRLNADGSIPPDNPFLAETTGKYRAIYARGVRNSFGLAAQPKADGGRLFFTDVGASAFEEVNELVAGANYGWPHTEGFSTNTAFKNPLYAYPPLVGQSIVGGAFYPRTRASNGTPPGAPASETRSSAEPFDSFPEKWRGRFFFADFMKHWIKALEPDAPSNILTFARGLNGPVATELASDGSLLVLNRGAVWRDPQKFVPNAGSLLRIRYAGREALAGARVPGNRPTTMNHAALGLPMNAQQLPARLLRVDWQHRVFVEESPAFWLNDGEWQPFMRVKTRVFLPTPAKVRANFDGTMDFPAGTVFVREFYFPAPGAGGERSRPLQVIERRLHVFGDGESYGASYRVDSQGDATLVEDGETAELGQGHRLEPGEIQRRAEITWWYPALEPRLGRPLTSPSYWIPTTLAEWNQTSGEGNGNSTALRELLRMNLLMDAGANAPVSRLPTTSDWRSAEGPAEGRVRVYLQANCAVCHQPGGASRGLFDARLATPLAQAGIVNGDLAAGDLGIAGAKVVVPGAPEKSILLRRLKDTGFFRMPPTQIHSETSPIVPLIEEWIRDLAVAGSAGKR